LETPELQSDVVDASSGGLEVASSTVALGDVSLNTAGDVGGLFVGTDALGLVGTRGLNIEVGYNLSNSAAAYGSVGLNFMDFLVGYRRGLASFMQSDIGALSAGLDVSTGLDLYEGDLVVAGSAFSQYNHTSGAFGRLGAGARYSLGWGELSPIVELSVGYNL
jgi:hypothetical protein